MTPEAARMLARAFATNPLHVAAFGTDELARNEAFFRIGLTVMKGPRLVALDGSRILGLIHWVDRAENVAFHARFGFETAAEIPVLGVCNYLMSRR